MIFNSALNAEFVYVILEGISQFSLLNYFKGGLTKDQYKKFRAMKYTVGDNGDTTVYLNKFLMAKQTDNVQNIDDWMGGFQPRKEYVEVKTKVAITYYRLYYFTELFEANNLSMRLLDKSLSPELNSDQLFKAGEGAGKSGSIFFFSHDNKYVVKTMNKKELDVFLKFIPNYVEHHKRNPRSLLGKIFGVFTIKKFGMSDVHVVLMENVMQFKDKSKLKYIFDLKGSIHSRIVEGRLSKKTVRKDLNWISDKKKDPHMLSFAKINQDLVRDMRRDVAFLKNRCMLDYSLLIAIEKTEDQFDELKILEKRRRYTAVSRNKLKAITERKTNAASVLSRKTYNDNGSNEAFIVHKNGIKEDEKGFLTFRNPGMSLSEVQHDIVRRSTETNKPIPIEVVKPEAHNSLNSQQEIHDDGLLSDDGESVDLTALSDQIM